MEVGRDRRHPVDLTLVTRPFVTPRELPSGIPLLGRALRARGDAGRQFPLQGNGHVRRVFEGYLLDTPPQRRYTRGRVALRPPASLCRGHGPPTPGEFPPPEKGEIPVSRFPPPGRRAALPLAA